MTNKIVIDWDTVSPKVVSLEDLAKASDEEFPETYSGQAWLTCWKMYHKEYKTDPEGFLKKDGWSEFPYLDGMGLTGFMVGWACNTLRYLLGHGPVRDGATLIIGAGATQPLGVHLDNAKTSVKVAIGGTKALDEDESDA